MPGQRDSDFGVEEILALIRAEFEALDCYLESLKLSEFERPTYCTEWNLRLLLSHLASGAETQLSTIKAGVGHTEPMTQEQRQALYTYLDGLEPLPTLEEFRARTRNYIQFVQGLDQAERQREIKTFAGEIPVADFMQFRLHELAIHSWDIRVRVDSSARVLPDCVPAQFQHARDTLNRRSNAVARASLGGTSFGIGLHGPVAGSFTLQVQPQVVALNAGAASNPDATLHLATEAFLRLYIGRLPLEENERRGEVVIRGDRAAALKLNALFPGY